MNTAVLYAGSNTKYATVSELDKAISNPPPHPSGILEGTSIDDRIHNHTVSKHFPEDDLEFILET